MLLNRGLQVPGQIRGSGALIYLILCDIVIWFEKNMWEAVVRKKQILVIYVYDLVLQYIAIFLPIYL